MLENAWHYQSCHPVARVDYHLERLHLAHVDEREGVFDIIIKDVTLRHATLGGRFGEIATYCQVANIGQACIQADWERLGATKFYAVVFAWIMRRSNHRAG